MKFEQARSADEFRLVMNRTLELMSSDPTMGPKLRDADTPQRWEFPDLDLTVRSNNEMAVSGQRLFHGAYGARTSHEESHDVPGENDNILQR